MDKQKLEDYYFERNSTIFSEMLDEDENYQRLKKAKLAAEKALQNVISKEVMCAPSTSASVMIMLLTFEE